MRTIAIVLGDNDFGNTFRPLLETLHRVILYRGLEYIDREWVADIIRAGVDFHYLAFQGETGRVQEVPRGYFDRLKILFDEEAEAEIAGEDHDGGAWYLELQSGSIGTF